MFKSEVYVKRREELHKKIKTGLALFIGNVEAPMNYPANTYHFRQDSDFLYFFGLDLPVSQVLWISITAKTVYSATTSTWMTLYGWGPQPKVKSAWY